MHAVATPLTHQCAGRSAGSGSLVETPAGAPGVQTLPALDVNVDEAEATASSPQWSDLEVVDEDGQPVPRKFAKYVLVNLPPYLPGAFTSMSGCYSAALKVQLDANTTFLNDCTGGPEGPWGMYTTKLVDHGIPNGFLAALGTGSSYPWAWFPWEPYLTSVTVVSGLDGVARLGAALHAGHPGLYALVAVVDGVRSSPAFYVAKSRLASIEIVTQPSREPNPASEFNTTGGAANPDGSYNWPVGSVLETPPKLRLAGADGAGIKGYQVSARAIDADTLAPLGPLAIF